MKKHRPLMLFRVAFSHAVFWLLFGALLYIYLFEIAAHTPPMILNFYFLMLVNIFSFYYTRYELIPKPTDSITSSGQGCT